MTERTYAVTLIKVGAGLPLVESGAYRYTGDGLPRVGETIAVSSASGANELRGYVTKVNPHSETPISVVETERPDAQSGDDFTVRPAAEA